MSNYFITPLTFNVIRAKLKVHISSDAVHNFVEYEPKVYRTTTTIFVSPPTSKKESPQSDT